MQKYVRVLISEMNDRTFSNQIYKKNDKLSQ